MSSRLASAPERVNSSFATSRMRSRFRCASARGLRLSDGERFLVIFKISWSFQRISKKLVTGDRLRYSVYVETLSTLRQAARLVNTDCPARWGERLEEGKWWKYLEQPRLRMKFFQGSTCAANEFS